MWCKPCICWSGWSQWRVLPWADTSKTKMIFGAELCIYYYFHLCVQGIPWAATKLPSEASPAGDRKRHSVWTGTCSISWRLSPFQASCNGCTATWGISCIIRIILGACIHWYVTCDSLMLRLHSCTRGVDFVLPLVGCVLSYDITGSGFFWYPLRKKGSGEDRWRWGQVLAHLKIHSLQFLLPRDSEECPLWIW